VGIGADVGGGVSIAAGAVAAAAGVENDGDVAGAELLATTAAGADATTGPLE